MTEDGIKMLKGAKFPLGKMALIGMVGASGSGKTYQALKILDEYIRLCD